MTALVPIFGIPYAPQEPDDKVGYVAVCPRCGARVALNQRKDGESFKGTEYADHYFERHAVADGLVLVDGVWMEPAR